MSDKAEGDETDVPDPAERDHPVWREIPDERVDQREIPDGYMLGFNSGGDPDGEPDGDTTVAEGSSIIDQMAAADELGVGTSVHDAIAEPPAKPEMPTGRSEVESADVEATPKAGPERVSREAVDAAVPDAFRAAEENHRAFLEAEFDDPITGLRLTSEAWSHAMQNLDTFRALLDTAEDETKRRALYEIASDQERGGITKRHLAEVCDKSERTIKRYIKSWREAGLVEAVHGIERSTYKFEDEYDRRLALAILPHVRE